MIPSTYAAFRDRLAEALDSDFYRIEYLDWLIAEKRAEILVTDKAAIVFEIKQYPSGAKVVHGLCAAGDLEDITELLIPAAEGWGRAEGCSSAIIESRPGWARQLKQQGYAVHAVAVRKVL